MHPKKYDFTAEEAAIMRRQYEDHVPMTVIGAQFGIEVAPTRYKILYRLFRKYDPNFESHAERNSKAKRWCAWCGIDLSGYPRRRKYCDDAECIEASKNPKNPENWCACGKRGWGARAYKKQYRCAACSAKARAAQRARYLHVVRYMAIGGYSNQQIAKEVGLCAKRVSYYRSQLRMPTPAKKWRPEQFAYWKAKVMEAGSAAGAWEKSGITYAAFVSRLRRYGFITSVETATEARFE
jgi:hypothetical protein